MIPILKADSFKSQPSIRFGMSTRRGGVSPEPLGMNLSYRVGDVEENVRQNRQLFFDALDIKVEELAVPRQVHSSTIRVVQASGSYPDCDALITNCRRVFLCVSVADCVPVFLFDEEKKIVAGIHAGWRGTAGKIVSRTVERMRSEFGSNPSKVIAFIGPCASECCYEVGEEIVSQFDPTLVSRRNGKVFLDLKSANAAQLVQSGVPVASIEVSPLCTITAKDLLHSFRRDGDRSGRMMGVIGLI